MLLVGSRECIGDTTGKECRKTKLKMEDIDELFEKLGVKDKMEEFTKIFTKIFTDNFMIRGEVIEDLQEIFHKAPDSLIEMMEATTINEEFVP